MEEDEDVVFEGSSLYEHLKTTGYTEFESVKPAVNALKLPNTLEEQTRWEKLLHTCKQGCESIKNYFNNYKWTIVNLLFSSIIKSNILLDEDAKLVLEWTEPKCKTFYLECSLLPIIGITFAPVSGILVFGVGSWCCWRYWGLRTKVSSYVLVTEELINILNKSLRLLREKLIVSRGFTFAVGSVPGKEEEQDLCHSFRKLLISHCIDIVMLYRKNLLDLLHHYPLLPYIDHSDQYISLLDINELIPEQNTSLHKIKEAIDVAIAVQSELLRRFILSYVPELCCESPSIYLLGMFLTELRTEVNHHVGALSAAYRYYKAPYNHIQRPYSEEKSTHPLYVPVRSLSLHLESALSKLYIIEDTIEKLSEEQIRSDLHRCKLEVDASNVCYEEAIYHIDKLYSNPKLVTDTTVTTTETPEKSPESTKLIPFTPYVPQDQVLIGVATQCEDEEQENVRDEEFYLAEQKKLKLEKEYTKKVFSELKNILIIKENEWKARERIALRRSANIDMDSDDQLDITDVEQEETNCDKEGQFEDFIENQSEEHLSGAEKGHSKTPSRGIVDDQCNFTTEDPLNYFVKDRSKDSKTTLEAFTADDILVGQPSNSHENKLLDAIDEYTLKTGTTSVSLPRPPVALTSFIASEVAAKSGTFRLGQEESFGNSDDDE